MNDDDYLQAIALGFDELRRWGTTSVCNLEAFPELLPKLPPPPLRTWWFLELIDLRSRVDTEALMAGALAFFEGREGWLGGFGLNPHAPYTASPELFRLCNACGTRFGMPLTTHIAESAEEEAMFARSEGNLYDFFNKLGRPMDDCGQHSAFSRAVHSGLIGPGWLLAHANELDEPDFALIAATPGDWHIVHCPQSHAYFQHRPFAWKRLEVLGVNLCLGTDSLASVYKARRQSVELSLFEEMRALAQAHPWLSARSIVRLVTLNGARALGLQGRIGELSEGSFADLIALPFVGRPAEVHDAILHHAGDVTASMIDGRWAIAPGSGSDG